jgi:1,4-alpha-glucan branching enzyme
MKLRMNADRKTPDEATETVAFSCDAPDAQTVYLIGDFNGWNHTAAPMQRRADGSWFLEVLLSHSRHYYQFLVDGKPVLDPNAMYLPLGARHKYVSIIALG